jgi:hypothetical protein
MARWFARWAALPKRAMSVEAWGVSGIDWSGGDWGYSVVWRVYSFASLYHIRHPRKERSPTVKAYTIARIAVAITMLAFLVLYIKVAADSAASYTSTRQAVPGVFGHNTANGDGVFGKALTTGRGVLGVSESGAGVEGHAKEGRGVVGSSDTQAGVEGYSNSP